MVILVVFNSFNLVKNLKKPETSLRAKSPHFTLLKTSAANAELKAEQDKTVKLQMHDLRYFLDKNFFGDDGFQNVCL